MVPFASLFFEWIGVGDELHVVVALVGHCGVGTGDDVFAAVLDGDLFVLVERVSGSKVIGRNLFVDDDDDDDE
jgi:hypothetical protein